jgi:hypothetical protein
MTKELATQPTEASMQALRNEFPQDLGFNRIMLPRLTFKSQDVTEGKGKAMKVVMEAGTFIEERETDDEDEETGKKIWEKKELGSEIEGIIIFQRKQLRYFDESTEEFTSSPIFDDENEVVPLFCNKAEIAKGTPAELKKNYEFTGTDGKVRSKLEENRILYVLMGDEMYQLNLRGSSMYSFLAYARKTLVPSVLTTMNSEPKEKGSIAWNQMTFTAKRSLTQAEIDTVLEKIGEIKAAIAEEKAYFGKQAATAPALVAGKDADDF